MRKQKSPLRGSVSQSNVSVRMRAREQSGIGFLTRLGLLAGGLIVSFLFLLWVWHTGWPQNQMRALEDASLTVTQKANFAVKDVIVEGRHQSDKDDVFDALGTEKGAPIFALDTKAAAARLDKLPWVGAAVVERRLPDTVTVILTERVPSARWQHDDKIFVIDNEGHVLTAARTEDFSSLPLVVGTGSRSGISGFPGPA